ncbi:MAG: Tex family protein [Oscillospiraceae bacterium]
MDSAKIIAREFSKSEAHVQNVINLIDEGNTVPFIARYRKEMHGTMDDTAIRGIADRLQYLRNLAQRQEEILRAIALQDKLTPELKNAVEASQTLAEAEDLYRPYKQKRRTRATIAKEKGLEPLAAAILEQTCPPESLAKDYVNPKKQIDTLEAALAGASDIIAEIVSDDASVRKALRELMLRFAQLISVAAGEADSVYRLYYDFSQVLPKLQGHQILAINRGEKEGFLKVGLEIDRPSALSIAVRSVIKPAAPGSAFVRSAAEDAYSRLIAPSMEREIRAHLTDLAAEGAIHNFALNLRPLLMQPPVKGAVTMGFDPGYRTGCKIAVVDATGKVLDTGVVYPTPPHNKTEQAAKALKQMIETHGVRHIAIGNGTASRESEKFIAELIRTIPDVGYMVVSEAGASVYSASQLGAEEFPDYDVSLRSAVSIARRLQDPLAELVKIDPKSIGVGQYQHDMPQARLDEALAGVVEDCVNAVGVDMNTASPALLRHVSGLSAATAKNIVQYREENGAFATRRQLLKVPKLGPKAYEQCAGFLRVPESDSILDNTAVHPESYPAAEKLLSLCGYSLIDVKMSGIPELPARLAKVGEAQAAAFCVVGIPTLHDLIRELQKPGRDPRDELPQPILRSDIMEISDLKPGMVLSGTVRNVIDFGAFVDIGVHQDGLVHISQICNKFIRHPSEAVSVGDVVRVVVLEVDEKKKRISLSIKQVREENHAK